MADEIDIIDQLVKALKNDSTLYKSTQQQLRQQAKSTEEYEKLNRQLRAAIIDGRQLKKLKDEELDLLEKLNGEFETNLKNLRIEKKIKEDLNTVGKKLVDSLFGLGDAQTQNADKIEYYTRSFESFPFVGKAVNEFGKSIDFNVDVFKALASLGADFNQSLVNLRIGSRNTLLPLMEFVDLIKENSSNLALLYGTVNTGTSRISDLSREIRANLIPQFASFGVTTDELNEYLGTYLALQRVQGRQEYLSTATSTEALRSYTSELDKVAKLTGIQRQELDKAVRAQQADAVLQSYLAGLAPARETEVRTFIAGLKALSPELGSAVSNLVATGFPLSQFEQNLVALNPGLMDSALAFREGTLSSEEFNNRLRTIANSTQRFDAGLIRGSEAVNASVTAFLPLKGTVTNFATLLNEQTKAQGGATGQVIELQESFRRFKSNIEGIQTVLLQQALPSLASGFGLTREKMDELGEKITKFGLEYPGLLTGAVVSAQAARYTIHYAKEVGLLGAGTAFGIRLAGAGGFFGPGGRGSAAVGAVGRGLGTAGRALPYVGAIAGVGYNAKELMDDNPDNNKRAILGLIGATMGGLLGLVVGPMGAAIGASIGSAAGNALGSMVEPRFGGGPVMTGSQYLVGEKGPELFTPKTAGTVTSNSDLVQMSKFQQMFGEQNAAFKQFADLSAKMEKHLNTLVSINARTETNTGNAVRRLANLGTDLV